MVGGARCREAMPHRGLLGAVVGGCRRRREAVPGVPHRGLLSAVVGGFRREFVPRKPEPVRREYRALCETRVGTVPPGVRPQVLRL